MAYRIDHAKLIYLARHRGPEVAAAIEANRERIEGNPMAARVIFHTKGGRP